MIVLNNHKNRLLEFCEIFKEQILLRHSEEEAKEIRKEIREVYNLLNWMLEENYFELHYIELQDPHTHRLVGFDDPLILNPFNQSLAILNDLLIEHPEKTQLLIYLLSCPKDLRQSSNYLRGEIIDSNFPEIEKLTNSSNKFSYYLKNRGQVHNESEENKIKQEFRQLLVEPDTNCAAALIYIVQRAFVPESRFMLHETFMVNVSDQYSKFYFEDQIDNIKFVKNLVNHNCQFFKSLLFFW